MKTEILSMQPLMGNGWIKRLGKLLFYLKSLHLKDTQVMSQQWQKQVDTINLLSAKVDALTKLVSKS